MNIVREGLEFVASIPTDIADATYGIANTIYYTATGHTLGKPLHSKVLVNNITTKLTNRKVFSNIPTDKELKDPNTAKKYFIDAVRHNNKELMEIVLEHATQDPNIANAVFTTAKQDLFSRIEAISKNKASPEDGSVASRELDLINQIVSQNKDALNYDGVKAVIKLQQRLYDEKWLKKYPQYKPAKEILQKYSTINKTLDYITLGSVFTFGAGKLATRVFKTPLLRAIGHTITATSTITPLAVDVAEAQYNHEGVLQAIRPIDVYVGGDILREAKNILATKEAIATHEAYNKLKDPNFNPIGELITHLSKKHDLTDKEIEEFKSAVMQAGDEKIGLLDTFNEAFTKNAKEHSTAILTKIISRKGFEEEFLQDDKRYIRAFLEHEPVKNYFIKNHSDKDGKIKIKDINQVEEDLSKLAKTDQVVANYMSYNRQKKFLGELVRAIEHGNNELSVSIIKPDGIEDRVIDLTRPLKSIVDEIEEEFKKDATISITYKTKNGDVVSRTIKSVYAPSNDEFRILQGKFKVKVGDAWVEIEDGFTIPLTRTHDIKNALKDIAKKQGFEDIEPIEVEYIKPATNIFPHKLRKLADRLLKLEEAFKNNKEKVFNREVKEYRKLVEEAYESGYLPHITEEGSIYTLEEYLQAKPEEVFKTIKNNIIQHTKNIISRNKEASGLFKEVVFDDSGSLAELIKRELKNYEKGVKDLSKDIVSETKSFIKEEADYDKELLETIKNSFKEAGDNLQQIKDAVNRIKSKTDEYIRDASDELASRLRYEFKRIEEFIKSADKKIFRKKDLKDLKVSFKGYRIVGKEAYETIKNSIDEIKDNYSEIAKSLENITYLIEKAKGISDINRSKLLNEIAEDVKLIKQSLDTKKLFASIDNFIKASKEKYKEATSDLYEANRQVAELRDLANRLATAERVALKDSIKLTDLLDSSATKIEAIADTLKKLATAPYPELRREGSGFATVFDNYDTFKEYATLKYLAPTFLHLKSIPFLHRFVEELEYLEARNPNGLNPTQKLVKDALNMYLHRDLGDLAKTQRFLGNLITLLNPSIALGNFVAGLQSLHTLFPSLDIMKIGEIKSVWNKEFKKMLYSEGLYKLNVLNPFYVGIETILKSHVLENLKDDKIFENVILDYSKLLGIKDNDVIAMLKNYYNERRDLLAEDIINYVSGLDVRALQTFAIKGHRLGESVMPWYRFIFAPFSIAFQIVKNWKDAPEYITRLGVGKVLGKALAFSTFSAIALGSQAVPFMAPAETPYSLAKTFINPIAVALGGDEIFTDKNFAEFVLKELDYHILKTGLLDPNERVNFYTSFGSALLQAIAGADANGWDTNPFVHALRVGLDIVSKIGASGLISPSAGSYVADIPAPAFTVIQNIIKKLMFGDDETTKSTQAVLGLLQSIPITNDIYKEIAGRSLVKGVGESGKEEIWQPSLPQELLSEKGQGLIGLLHLIGFMALNGDAIFNGNEIQKAYQLFKYELATDKKDMFSPVLRPEEVDYYKLLNFKDYKVFRNNPEDIIATLKYIPENKLEDVRVRANKLMIDNLTKMVKMLQNNKSLTDKQAEELKHRYEALQNYIIVADYLDWDKLEDGETAYSLDQIRQFHKKLYEVLKNRQIDVDYKDVLRIKRKLQERN